jgi:glycosyltransferase involved in cell wall biosynthesis
MNNPYSTVCPDQPGDVCLFHGPSYLAALPESERLGLKLASEEELLNHWLNHGVVQGFSPTPRFISNYYLESNPDVKEAGLIPWLHWCEYGAREGRLPHPQFPKELLQGRTGPAALRVWIAEVGEVPPKLEFLEPLWRKALTIEPMLGRLQINDQLHSDKPYKGSARAKHICNIRALMPNLRRLVLLPQLDLGGAIRVASHAVKLAATIDSPYHTLLVCTDGSDRAAASWFSGTGFIYGLCDDPINFLNREQASLLIAQIILGLRPSKVLIANSAAGWDAILRWGKQLSKFSSITAQLNCRDYGPNNIPIGGYADDQLRKSLPYLEAVIFDHRHFADHLVKQFALPKAESCKLKLQYQPVPYKAAVKQLGEKILWAGRLTEQKRPQLLAEVARLLPHRSFEIWSPFRAIEAWNNWGLELPNVHWCGEFTDVETLPLISYGAYLHTAAFEGMPNLVLELGSYAMPVVASDVGGLSELLNHQNSWLVNTSTGNISDHAERLVVALEQVFSNREVAYKRALKLQECIRNQHSYEAYATQASCLSSFFRLAY